MQQAERTLNVTATLAATNIGGGAGRTFTVKLNSKAKISTVTVNGAAATFRPGTEPRGDLFKAEVSLPNMANPGANATLVVNYTLPVESNSGLAAISPVGTAFLPLSFWYPMPNTPFTLRGADTAPFHLTVNMPGIISSGVEKSAAGSSTFDQSLSAQPFLFKATGTKWKVAVTRDPFRFLLAKGQVPKSVNRRKHL